MQRHDDSEKGAAMVLVLGIVAVMSSMAIFSFDSLSRLIALSGAKASEAQTRHYAMGAEMLAIDVGSRLVRQRMPLQLLISQNKHRFQQNIGEAQLIGELRDATNCFNLTSLVTGNNQSGWQANMAAIRQFSRLLQSQGLGSQAALAISSALADWQDSDSDPLPLGAESAFYAERSPAYQTPNAPMRSVSEIRLIRDVSPRLIEQLGDLICADTVSLSNPININTLTPRHAPLLAALLGPDVSEMSIRNLIADRPEQGFTDTGRFWAHPALAFRDLKDVQKGLFKAYPRRLHVQIDVALTGIKNRMNSDIHFYPDGTYTIISRSFGNM